MPQDAVGLFRRFAGDVRTDRGFFNEWGVCEGEIGNHTANALLAALSISDGADRTQVDNEQAKKSLSGLGLAFGRLYAAYHDLAFRDAQAAVAALGLRLRVDDKARYFDRFLAEAAANGAQVPAIPDAFDLLRSGVFAAQHIGVHGEVAAIVPDARKLEFGGLRRLITAVTQPTSR